MNIVLFIQFLSSSSQPSHRRKGYRRTPPPPPRILAGFSNFHVFITFAENILPNFLYIGHMCQSQAASNLKVTAFKQQTFNKNHDIKPKFVSHAVFRIRKH